MKKILTKILVLAVGLSGIQTSAFAKNGDIIGYAKYSDIAAYINHYPITSYNIKDNTVVVAEDLQNYGFNAEWNGEKRSLSITRNTDMKKITPYGTVYKYSNQAGQNSYPYLETDITAYVNGERVESFNIDGKTCIYLNDLVPYGEVVWVPEVRALKMWIEDLPMQNYSALSEAPVPAVSAVSSSAGGSSASSSAVQALKDCERYVTLSYLAANVISSSIDVYKLNHKASLLVDIQSKITLIDSNLSKIRNITANERMLYPLYSHANITSVAATSYNIYKVSSYAQSVKNMKSAYDALCKSYGLQ